MTPFDAFIDARGVGIAWNGSRGVTKAELARPEALRSESEYLGIGEGPSVAPVVLRVGDGVAVAYVDGRGVSLFSDGEASLLFDGGINVAACVLGSVVAVATSDGSGVHAVVGDKRFALSQRSDARSLRIAGCGGNLLAFFTVEGGLVVVRLDTATGEIKEVTHPLREAARELDVSASANRVAVAVAYASDHVDLGIFDVNGAARERVHPVLRASDTLTHPGVSWVRTGFVVSAWQASAERALLAEGGQEKAAFDEVTSPFRLAALGEELYCIEVREDSVEGAALHLHVRGPELSTRRSPVLIEPGARPVRELARKGREFMRALAAKQVTSGYRGGAAGAVDVDSMSGELHGQASPVTYSLAAKGMLQIHVEVRIGELGDEESASLWRLATWVRSRWSPSSRAQAVADVEWAHRATGQEVLGVERTGAMIRIQLRLDDFPRPDAFMAWLRDLARGPET